MRLFRANAREVYAHLGPWGQLVAPSCQHLLLGFRYWIISLSRDSTQRSIACINEIFFERWSAPKGHVGLPIWVWLPTKNQPFFLALLKSGHDIFSYTSWPDGLFLTFLFLSFYKHDFLDIGISLLTVFFLVQHDIYQVLRMYYLHEIPSRVAFHIYGWNELNCTSWNVFEGRNKLLVSNPTTADGGMRCNYKE